MSFRKNLNVHLFSTIKIVDETLISKINSMGMRNKMLRFKFYSGVKC